MRFMSMWVHMYESLYVCECVEYMCVCLCTVHGCMCVYTYESVYVCECVNECILECVYECVCVYTLECGAQRIILIATPQHHETGSCTDVDLPGRLAGWSASVPTTGVISICQHTWLFFKCRFWGIKLHAYKGNTSPAEHPSPTPSLTEVVLITNP